jgi:hypothetical protein
MTNKTHRSIISARGTALGGRLNGSLRVYSLGGSPNGDIYFSLKLWLAAAQRQRRLSSPAYAAR